MKFASHCISAVPLAVAASAATGGSLMAAFGAIIGSVLIDCDHILDYVIHNGKWDGVDSFVAACRGGCMERRFMVLHSIELLLFLWILVGIGAASAWGVGLTIGMSGHVLLDWISNRRIVQPSFYWLWFRAANRFDTAALHLVPQEAAGSRRD